MSQDQNNLYRQVDFQTLNWLLVSAFLLLPPHIFDELLPFSLIMGQREKLWTGSRSLQMTEVTLSQSRKTVESTHTERLEIVRKKVMETLCFPRMIERLVRERTEHVDEQRFDATTCLYLITQSDRSIYSIY